ncbi:hypothetical protein PHET_10295 [Paragonimus heterotremus]|uniref:Uncharacterized protein n=1 Tax=Paragonimus heterotremus TaxID=100268 RepID=A0A8J4WU05_9TREM|nr:hypothetical protein PHET_10295 [Paragonimus heterotremus]
MSSVRRSVTTGLSSTASATTKRLTTPRPVNSYRVRSTPVTRAPIAKIASLSSKSKRRGSSSVDRAHRWAHKRVVRKKRRNGRSSTSFSSSAHSTKMDLLSPSADQTPPLRTNESTFDIDPPCLQNPKSSVPLSPVSDTTSPVEPTPTDSCAYKSETVDQVPENNTLTLLQECVEKHASDLSPAKSLSEATTSALNDGDLGVLPENSQSTPRLMTQSFSTPTNSANDSSLAITSLQTRALRHRRRNRGRGRNEPPPRISIINSLFQNPLRQKAPQPRLAPPSKICDSHPFPSSTTSTIQAPSSKQPTPGSVSPTVPTAVSRPDRATHANRGRNSHYSKRRDRVPQSSPQHRSSPQALDASTSKATFDRNDINKSSPASDSTEPMTEVVRAKLLEITQTPPFDFKSDDNTKSVNSELKLVTFSGQSFGTLRSTGLKPADSLPSSPSSIESSFSSSASSISNLDLNDTVRIKRPENFSIKSCSGERRQLTTMRIPCLPDVPSLIPTRSHLSPSCSSFASSTLSSVDTLKPSIGASPLRPLDMPHSPSTCPPPLLPLSTQLFDTSQSRSLILHPLRSEHTGVLPPPPLVPVSEFGAASTKPESSFSVMPKSCDATESTDLDAHRSSGVGLLGSVKVREKLASSLSPSSSSSTSSSLSSSGSTPAGSYCVDRVPIKITQPTPARESRPQQSPSPFTVDQHGPAKTPKIVIRLGGTGTPGGVTRLQSSLDKSYDQLDHSDSVCTDVGSNLKSAHPPPLRLTIYRDRLATYRGSSSSHQADSNSSSSSSGSETLLSSGDEDDRNTLSTTRPVHLPPPPCLERLPDGASLTTNENVSNAPPLISCRSDEPKVGKLLLTSRSSPLRDSDRNADVTHNQLPPLLPLFSTLSQPAISADSRHSSPSTDLTNVLERTITKQNSSVNLSKKRKRPRSKEKDRANKRRLVVSETTNPSIRIQPPVHMSVEKVQHTFQPRVRVDSVFTDDENDSKNDSLIAPSSLEKLSLIPVNLDSCARGSAVSAQRIPPKACKSDTSLSSSPKVNLKLVGDSKRAKGRPRTKHTADLATTNYSPVVKASPKPDPQRPSQSPVVRSKQHSRVKHIPASASTSSSSMPVRGLSGSQRQTSQVVVASAGSSYYFVSSLQLFSCSFR